MYINMYVCTYIYTYIWTCHMHILYVYTYAYSHVCTYDLCAYAHACVRACVLVYSLNINTYFNILFHDIVGSSNKPICPSSIHMCTVWLPVCLSVHACPCLSCPLIDLPIDPYAPIQTGGSSHSSLLCGINTILTYAMCIIQIHKENLSLSARMYARCKCLVLNTLHYAMDAHTMLRVMPWMHHIKDMLKALVELMRRQLKHTQAGLFDVDITNHVC